MTHAGCLRASTEPGWIAKRAPRAPWYSRRLHVAQPDVRQQARQQRDVDRVGLGRLLVDRHARRERAAWRSWPARSCHSRTRR